MSASTELGIPYLRPCASHHSANLPSFTARSKATVSSVSWSSASEFARVTTRRGNATFVAPLDAARVPAIKVSLPAPLGPTISTKRPGPMRPVAVAEEASVVMRSVVRHTKRCAQQLHYTLRLPRADARAEHQTYAPTVTQDVGMARASFSEYTHRHGPALHHFHMAAAGSDRHYLSRGRARICCALLW